MGPVAQQMDLQGLQAKGNLMSDIDHLEDIADANAFGYQGHRRQPNDHCGGGHLWTEQTTRKYRYRGRMRRVCRICDAARRRKPMQCTSIAPSIAPGIAQAGAE